MPRLPSEVWPTTSRLAPAALATRGATAAPSTTPDSAHARALALIGDILWPSLEPGIRTERGAIAIAVIMLISTENQMRQLTSLDAQFLAMESPRQYGHVSGIAVLDPTTAPGGKLELADVQNLIAERLSLLPIFRWRLAEVPFGLDYPYWIEDPDFDLDFHVRELALPAPGTDAKLTDQVARIFARPLDRTRPLWELYLIHGLEGGRVALLTKIHHAVVDGMSGAEILGVLLDLSPQGREAPPPAANGTAPMPGQLEMLVRGIIGLPKYPLRVLESLPGALPNIEEVGIYDAIPGAREIARAARGLQNRLGLGGDVQEREQVVPPRTSFNGRISPHRRLSIGKLSLDAVKAVKNEHESTVNDVVVSICAGPSGGG